MMRTLVNISDLSSADPAYALDPQSLNILCDWAENAIEPLMFKGELHGGVVGRSLQMVAAEKHGCGLNILITITALAATAPSEKTAEIKAFIKEMLLSDTEYGGLIFAMAGMREANMLATLLDDESITRRGDANFARVYGGMDRAVKTNADYSFGVAMSSYRIGAYESITKRNVRAWYTGDGMTYLYTNDLKKYTDAYWAAVDYHRISGTTVETMRRDDAKSDGIDYKSPGDLVRTNSWAGGSEISGRYAAVGMEITPHTYFLSNDYDTHVSAQTTLNAKKSWFMFDDEIVALGAGITATGVNTVETILENYKLNEAGDNAFIVNGTPMSTALGPSGTSNGVNTILMQGNAQYSDVGYYFPTPQSVSYVREARTGNFKDVDALALADPITRNYLAFYIDHGLTPDNASYSYVVIPNTTGEALAGYAQKSPVTVLQNNALAQAVNHSRLRVTGINFWTDTVQTVAGITSDKKASVMLRDYADRYELAVSDPTHLASVITLNLVRGYKSVISKDSAVTVNGGASGSSASVNINVAGAKGKTFTVVFEKEEVETEDVVQLRLHNGVDGVYANENYYTGTGASRPAAPTRRGYSFGGWRDALSGGASVSFPLIMDTDKTVYAAWIALPMYTVIFDTGGAASVPPQNLYEGETAVKPPDPSRDGYSFAGWHRDAVPWNFSTPVNSNITLTAIWELLPALYTVTFDSLGGGYVAPIVLEEGDPLVLPAAPSKNGYSFIGWYKDADCVSAWSEISDTVSGDITLYAKWLYGGLYTVTFDSKGGSAVDSVTVLPETLVNAPVSPALNGYKFAGWYGDETYSQRWSFATDTVNGDITLFAKWAPDESESYIPPEENGCKSAASLISASLVLCLALLKRKFINKG
jgi:uncharacterized repeat protein (TIGR02543 family)